MQPSARNPLLFLPGPFLLGVALTCFLRSGSGSGPGFVVFSFGGGVGLCRRCAIAATRLGSKPSVYALSQHACILCSGDRRGRIDGCFARAGVQPVVSSVQLWGGMLPNIAFKCRRSASAA